MTVKISLTQFINVTSRVSTSAKISVIRKMKSDPYSPATDYWKYLRDAIQEVAAGRKPLDYILDVATNISDEKKQENYLLDAKKFISFVKSNNVEFFIVGHATWKLNEDFVINASPEIGMKIDGQKYCVKIYYKVPNKSSKLTKRSAHSMLTMMYLSTKDFSDTDLNFALLNLQNGKIIPSTNTPNESDKLELMTDAAMIKGVWDNV